MEAFHNDHEFKARLIAAAAEHRKAGDYTAEIVDQPFEFGQFHGSSVECSIYDVQRLYEVVTDDDYRNHRLLAATLGVPESFCRLQDAIFLGLPRPERVAWTERLYTAIPVGADIRAVLHRLAIRRLTRLADAQRIAIKSAPAAYGLRYAVSKSIAALYQVLACHRTALAGCTADWSAAEEFAWSAVRSAEAAWMAVRSAGSSAQSAWWPVAGATSRSARSAAWSASEEAWSAEESAAESAADFAARSAWSEPKSEAWEREAGDLIELLENA